MLVGVPKKTTAQCGALMANAASALSFVAGGDQGGNPAGLGESACSVSHSSAWDAVPDAHVPAVLMQCWAEADSRGAGDVTQCVAI